MRRFEPPALVLYVLLFVSLACNGFESESRDPDPSALETAVVGTATAISRAGPNPSILQEGSENPCDIPEGSPKLPDLLSKAERAQGLLEYLNAGGSIAGLETFVIDSRLGPAEGPALIEADITGDGQNDLTISLRDSDQEPFGVLFVYTCFQKSYRLSFATSPGMGIHAPVIRAHQDLTADGVADLLISKSICGAHTCSWQVEILTYVDGQPQNRLQGNMDDMPSPRLELLGPNHDGSIDIALTATGISSVGAGPFRQFTRIWSWDSHNYLFIPSEDSLLPPTYRIHLVHDADLAYSEGAFPTAIELFDRVIVDNNLDDWIEGEEGRAILSAYALFRQLLSHLQMNEFGSARSTYEALLANYPADIPGHSFGELAMQFWTEYQQEGDFVQACAVAQQFAMANQEDILEPLVYGYANRLYVASDICS